MKYSLIFFFSWGVFLFLHNNNVFGQNKTKINYIEDALYALKVKQVDEFIDRFNNESKIVSKGISFKRRQLPLERRKILINSLFNAEKKWDERLKQKFLAQVNTRNKNSYLSFYDQSWFAKVKSKVIFKGKEYPMDLTLRVQINPDLSSKWVIIGVKAAFLRLPEPTNMDAHINPTNHNLKFNKLPRVLKDSLNLKSYVNSEFKEDKLTLLFYEIMQNDLRMKSIDEITFHFLQLKNWLFVLRKFNRESSNSGWLIDELYQKSWEEKGSYLVNQLNLY